ncbi:MAG TPA: hypothetical protein VJB98_04315 [Candidatus Paceibacterota bacterium]
MAKNHWKDEEIDILDRITTCREMFTVAQKVIDRMPRPISQVCGPISTGGVGSIAGNLARMAEAIEYLEQEGRVVFNQLPFEVPMVKMIKARKEPGYVMEILNDFYLPIFESGHISTLHFLPDWQSSVGASWEHDQARRLGLEIEYFDHDWGKPDNI